MSHSRPFAAPIHTARWRCGMTLVDLVITVLIVGILAAVAAPRFTDAAARLNAESVARRIAGDLNYARRIARQTSRTVSITFRATPPGYDMTGVEHPAHAAQSYSVNIADIDGSVRLSSYNFDGGAKVSFNNYGRPLVGSLALVAGTVVVRSGSHSVNVTIDPSTGEASIP